MGALKLLFPGKTPEQNFQMGQEVLPVGMRVVAIWPDATPLPLESTLMAALSPMGTPWKADLASEVQHVGVDLTTKTTVLELLLLLNQAAGHAPALFQVPDSAAWDGVISATETLKEISGAAQDLGESAGDLVSGTISSVKILLWAPLVIGGVLVLVGITYFGVRAYREHEKAKP